MEQAKLITTARNTYTIQFLHASVDRANQNRIKGTLVESSVVGAKYDRYTSENSSKTNIIRWSLATVLIS